MHNLSITGEGESRGQPANPGSRVKMAIKTECDWWSGLPLPYNVCCSYSLYRLLAGKWEILVVFWWISNMKHTNCWPAHAHAYTAPYGMLLSVTGYRIQFTRAYLPAAYFTQQWHSGLYCFQVSLPVCWCTQCRLKYVCRIRTPKKSRFSADKVYNIKSLIKYQYWKWSLIFDLGLIVLLGSC